MFIAIFLSLVGCNTDNSINQYEGPIFEGGLYLIEDASLIGTLESLPPIPYLVDQQIFNRDSNELILRFTIIDLITGDIMGIREFNSKYSFFRAWVLENDNFAINLYNRNTDEVYLYIFNNAMEELGVIELNAYTFWSMGFSYLQIKGNDFYLYGIELETNEEWTPRPILNPTRLNLLTGEKEVIFEVFEPIQSIHGFINEKEVFATERIVLFEQGILKTRYGLLNLEDEVLIVFDKENFGYGRIDIGFQKVLIAEGTSVGPLLLNEVILFDISDTKSFSVTLATTTSERTSESVWARLSYNEDYIVTINDDFSVFRKYDFDGNIIIEKNIIIPMTIQDDEQFTVEELANGYFRNIFDIIPITEQVYIIHTKSFLEFFGWYVSEHHFQTVVLP